LIFCAVNIISATQTKTKESFMGIYAHIGIKRLLFVTGKGGVGKTTMAMALAQGLADQGKSVWVIDISKEQRVRLSRDGSSATANTQFASELARLPFKQIHLDSKEAIDAYVKSQVKLEIVKRIIVGNRILKHFFNVAPGLSELMILHAVCKLMESHPEDIFILDAHAFGHGFSLLHAPFLLDRFIRFGPMKTLIRNILSGINEKNCFLLFVTLPAETPIVETIEYYVKFAESIFPPHAVVLNMCFPAFGEAQSPFDKNKKGEQDPLEIEGIKGDELTRLIHHADSRVQQDRHFFDQLASRMDVPISEVPLVTESTLSPLFYRTLAQHLR
jgi:anion-transporting  ArsA/GET3 family ATPase